MPPDLGISPIFNVCDMYPYKGPTLDLGKTTLGGLEDDEWVKDLPTPNLMQLESILDTKVLRKTRKGNYKEYLIKWNGLSEAKGRWMIEVDIIKHGVTI